MAETEAPKEKKKFEEGDWKNIADFGVQELARRIQDRKDLEKQWDEVDRQIKMENRVYVADPKWCPETELPLQAEAEELLVSDAMRFLFPTDRNFFSTKAALLPEDLPKLNFDAFVGGKATPIQKMIAVRGPQDLANNLATSFLNKFHSLFDLKHQIKLACVESFRYGNFVARVPMVESDVYDPRSKGVKAYPAWCTMSVREMYLDDSPAKLFRDGLKIGPAHIRHYYMSLDDLRLAAKGSKDADDQFGGWKPDNLDGLEAKTSTADAVGQKNKKIPPGHIEVIEIDGDVVVASGEKDSLFLKSVIVTITPQNGKVIRYRKKKFLFNDYITDVYHPTGVGMPYGSSPLLKGAPIQNAATYLLKRLLIVAALRANPPGHYSPSDQWLAATGGPVIEPGAMNAAMSEPDLFEIGDPVAAAAAYELLLTQFENLSGVNAPRRGQQTKSHQTAFAIDTEQTRGQTRTINFTRGVMTGALTTYLCMAYEKAKTVGPMVINIPEYDGFVRAAGANLPDIVEFLVTGAGTPLEERERRSAQIQAIQANLQLEPLAIQLGGTPLNVDEIRKLIFRMGGILDPDNLFAGAPGAVPGGFATGQAVPGAGAGVPVNTAA